MTDRLSLMRGIRNRLGHAVNIGFNNTFAGLSDLYEFYIFTILIQAAKNEDGIIGYRDNADKIAQNLIFRHSPGQIYANTQPYTHAVIEFPNKPVIEAHIGIKIQGKSKVAHETDICVLFKEEADFCRNNNCEPRYTKVIIAIECKYYGSQLQLGLGRGFIGLASDLPIMEDIYFISNTYSQPIEKLLTVHKKKWERDIKPNSNNNLERLMYSFQRNFKDFKARN